MLHPRGRCSATCWRLNLTLPPTTSGARAPALCFPRHCARAGVIPGASPGVAGMLSELHVSKGPVPCSPSPLDTEDPATSTPGALSHPGHGQWDADARPGPCPITARILKGTFQPQPGDEASPWSRP
ncbi:hypothetical protein KIL84_009344 [Mauremys mutica]|uniref:Uncharacterized protein n=1 Tax=Mauremys mutica TaxID=74926 RepID=A0A9D4B3W4_9SAUR|nr:hypothetical protein KIL84_009344 [Mauremys mutica]